MARIEAVTLDDVMAIANRVLGAKPSAAIVGKKAEKYLQKIGD